MTDDVKQSRGRPRNFDRDSVLSKAMETFWSHGFDNTSMSQLREAMGIKAPSLYATFGSKEQLFREAVSLYISTAASTVWDSLEAETDTVKAVQRLLSAAIDSFVATEPPRGCLVLMGAGYMTEENADLKQFLQQERIRFQQRLVEKVLAGIKANQLRKNANPEVIAQCIIAFLSGLALEAVNGSPKQTLQQSAEEFCQQLLG